MRIVFACEMNILLPGQNDGGTEQAIACLSQALTKMGHDVEVITWQCFDSKPKNRNKYAWVCEVLARMGKLDVVNITTQGPLGFLVRRYCVARKIPFTVTYHTKLPQYLKNHGFPLGLSKLYLRWFLNGATLSIAPTPSMADELKDFGVNNAVDCAHGVDTDMFQPGDKKGFDHLGREGPYWLFVGRLVKEKNLRAFLDPNVDLPGTKVVVGDGPLRHELERDYPNVIFLGTQKGAALARCYNAATVLMFPSLEDTYGLVIPEGWACGIPAAAFPVTGPISVITNPRVGVLDLDLRKAALAAWELARDPQTARTCREYALAHSWTVAAEKFLVLQTPAGAPQDGAWRLWFEQKFNLPMLALEPVVYHVNHLLF